MIIYVWIFCLIFTGFLLLFGRIRWVETAKSLLSRTKKGMDQSARLPGVGKPAQAAGATA